MVRKLLAVASIFALLGVVALSVALADQVPGPSATVSASPVVTAQPVIAAPAQVQLPQFTLPPSHDVGTVVAWMLAVLFPCLGWLLSEIMPFLPGKANGILHGAVEALKAPSIDPQTQKFTIDLQEIKTALADIKGTQAVTNMTAAVAPAMIPQTAVTEPEA